MPGSWGKRPRGQEAAATKQHDPWSDGYQWDELQPEEEAYGDWKRQRVGEDTSVEEPGRTALDDWGAPHIPRRVQPRRPEPDSKAVNFTVDLRNVPREYTHATLVELHESLGLDVSSLESSKFGAREDGDQAATRTVILRYSDETSARQAAEELHQQQVAGEGDAVKTLNAKFRASGGVKAINPSVYISDVPLEYTEETLRELHEASGLEALSLISAKFLPSRDPTGETCCCIARYRDDASAGAAIEALRGLPVQTTSGTQKHLGARMAKPANWMVKSGVADTKEAPAEREPRPPVKRELPSWEQGQRDAPPAEEARLQRGTVKSWMEEKGYGFIIPEDGGPDIWVHRTKLCGGVVMAPRAKVVFEARWDRQRGKFAAERCLPPSAGDQIPPAVLPVPMPAIPMMEPGSSPPGPDESHGLEVGTLITGVVKAWHEDRGFGFVVQEGGGPDIFVHRNALRDGDRLEKGSTVSFEVQWDSSKRKWLSKDCFGATGTPPTSSEDVKPDRLPEIEGFAEAWDLKEHTTKWLSHLSGEIQNIVLEEFVDHQDGLEGLWSDSDANIFVGGLPLDADEEYVKQLLLMYGEVVRCKVLPAEGKNKSALVLLADSEQASSAIEQLNETTPPGEASQITVRFVTDKTEKQASDVKTEEDGDAKVRAFVKVVQDRLGMGTSRPRRALPQPWVSGAFPGGSCLPPPPVLAAPPAMLAAVEPLLASQDPAALREHLARIGAQAVLASFGSQAPPAVRQSLAAYVGPPRAKGSGPAARGSTRRLPQPPAPLPGQAARSWQPPPPPPSLARPSAAVAASRRHRGPSEWQGPGAKEEPYQEADQDWGATSAREEHWEDQNWDETWGRSRNEMDGDV
mmetsp:Transcript_2519/g.5789  ORF Transcript_2519/g.5789 Transcript_2519/m.5789 type:complete len:860 (+) Transcript_2519:52-2631(+)